jgi:hypothetical protein
VHACIEECEQPQRPSIARQCAKAGELTSRRDCEGQCEESKRPEPGAYLSRSNLIGTERALPEVDGTELGEPVEREMQSWDETENERDRTDDRVQQQVGPPAQKFLRKSIPLYRLAT